MENLEERETDASEVVSFAVVVFLLLLPLLLLPILLFPLLFYKCSTKCIITGLCIISIILIAMIALIVKFKMWTAQAWFSTTTISRTYFFAFGSKYLCAETVKIMIPILKVILPHFAFHHSAFCFDPRRSKGFWF